MDKTLLPTSGNPLIPEKWRPKYILKRIGEDDIMISQETRNEILKQLAKNGRYIQIGEYTIMLNSIKSIDPYWGPKNIPPRPAEKVDYLSPSPDKPVIEKVVNQDELDEWDKYFGESKKNEEVEKWLEK